MDKYPPQIRKCHDDFVVACLTAHPRKPMGFIGGPSAGTETAGVHGCDNPDIVRLWP